MAWRPTQDEMTAAATEAQENVLRAASQRHRIEDRTRFETAIVHPVAKSNEIDEMLPAIAAHPRMPLP
jgi:hypothetical protein